MSSGLISRSEDLQKLADAGFDIEVRGGHLVLHGLPYVDGAGAVKTGRLVSVLELSGERTASPSDHTAYFQGDYPHRASGGPLEVLRNQDEEIELEAGLKVQHRFSAKPRETGKYRDYFEKMSRYAEIISREARLLEPGLKWRSGRIAPRPDAPDPDDPFLYTETASGRAGITELSNRVRGQRLAIVGLGGSGSYIPGPGQQDAGEGDPSVRPRRVSPAQRLPRAGRMELGRAAAAGEQGGNVRPAATARAGRASSAMPGKRTAPRWRNWASWISCSSRSTSRERRRSFSDIWRKGRFRSWTSAWGWTRSTGN